MKAVGPALHVAELANFRAFRIEHDDRRKARDGVLGLQLLILLL